jgi:hypothetical protein
MIALRLYLLALVFVSCLMYCNQGLLRSFLKSLFNDLPLLIILPTLLPVLLLKGIFILFVVT